MRVAEKNTGSDGGVTYKKVWRMTSLPLFEMNQKTEQKEYQKWFDRLCEAVERKSKVRRGLICE